MRCFGLLALLGAWSLLGACNNTDGGSQAQGESLDPSATPNATANQPPEVDTTAQQTMDPPLTTPGPDPDPPASTGAAPTEGLPCDVVAILDRACVQCHGAMPIAGAPLSLLTAADFAAPGLDGMSVGERVLVRVQDPIRPMPPPPQEPLSPAEIGTLDAFVLGGALTVADGCDVNDPGPAPPNDGMGGGDMPVVVTPDPAAQDGTGTTNPVDVMPSGEGEWRMFGHDLANSRANTAEETISPDTVNGLQMQWQFNGPATTSTPAVADGIVYLPAWDGKVYAMGLADGSSVWTANLPSLVDSSPAVTDTQVFVSDNVGVVHALSRDSGDIQWSVPVDMHPHAHLWSSPVYIPDANLVVVGVASGEEAVAPPYTFRGSVVGLDAESGQIRWQFYTTPGDATAGAGIAVWATAAVDPTRSALYVGTGNNYAAPTGEYADSLLAIDYNTGDLLWSHQFTPEDVFTTSNFLGGPDADVGSTANLFSVDGQDLVGIGVKNGNYYALDRDSGQVQWMAMLTVGSVLGGVISPSAYADGMVFIASNRYLEGLTDLVAIDARGGAERWRKTLMGVTYSGVSYANGVVYAANDSAQIQAFNAETGDMLWNDAAPNATAAGPSVVDGLLLVPWGYQWTLGRGLAGNGGLIAYGL